MRKKRETLSSMPNSFLNSLKRSFLGRSAKKAERAALNVALELNFFELRNADEGKISRYLLFNLSKQVLPLPGGSLSSPRNASAPAEREGG